MKRRPRRAAFARPRTVLPGRFTRVTLLSVTVLGTMSNNIINVPLRSIATEFGASLSEAVLTVSAFVLLLAIAMPLMGWLGDRVGRKQVVVGALVLMTLAQLAAAASPGIEPLIAIRAVQGLACAAIPPTVMGMLAELYPGQRTRAMGAWAAANGVGQAVGPPVGGLVSDWFGWRWIFVMLAVLAVLTCLATLKHVPATARRVAGLHVPGAILLTGGVGALLVAATTASQPSIPLTVDLSAAAFGLGLLFGFVAVSRNQPRAMIPPRLIIESRFLRSAVAVFCQMFVLGSVLVAVPLIFTGPMELSTSSSGLLFFTLPVVMTLGANVVGRAGEHVSPRMILRGGLLVLTPVSVVIGLLTDNPRLDGVVWLSVALLAVLGLGVAMVQTPAASGATRSPAGQHGAALGLFSMLRFSGSTVGTAWVALVLPGGHVIVLFCGCAVVALSGFAMSFLGPDPTSESV